MSTRKKTFLLGAVLMSIVNLSMRTVSLYFSAFVLSRIGEEGVGLFTLLMNVFSFAVTLVSAGIGLAVTTSVAAELEGGAHTRQRRIVRAALLYSGTLSALAMLLLLLFRAPITSLLLGDTRAGAPLCILAFSLPAIALSSVLGG